MSQKCLITNSVYSEKDIITDSLFNGIIYKVNDYGIIKISHEIMKNLENVIVDNISRNILKGYIRNKNIKDGDVFEITSILLNDLKKPTSLNSIEDIRIHLLKYIEKRGGKLRKPFNLYSANHYTITFSQDETEYKRILKYLYDNSFIEINEVFIKKFPRYAYNVNITDEGKKFLHPDYKKSILDKLAENIYTGDLEVDAKLEHAKILFYSKSQNSENKRSACKTLADILEPIRERVTNKGYFFKKDIQDFFDLVNRFDIRHNKTKTKTLEYEEQFEWIFYSLLNTIITYYKMVKRYG